MNTWGDCIGAALGNMEAPVAGEPEFGDFIRLHEKIYKQFANSNMLRVDYATEILYGRPDH